MSLGNRLEGFAFWSAVVIGIIVVVIVTKPWRWR